MPPEFWHAPQMREALASRHMGQVFYAYRTHPFHGRVLSQEVLAGWLGLNQGQLSRIENGSPPQDLTKLMSWAHSLKIPGDLLWFALAKEAEPPYAPRSIVTVPPEQDSAALLWQAMSDLLRRTLLQGGLAAMPTLLSGGQRAGSPVVATPPQTSWAAPIHAAVVHPTDAARRASRVLDSTTGKPLALAKLRQAADRTVQVSLASDYDGLAESLPGLIGQAELVHMQASDADESEVQRLCSDVYAVAGWALIKADSPVAAWLAANRAIQAAETASDPLRAAAAMRCLAEVYMRAGHLEEASRTALIAATYLHTAPRSAMPETVSCLRGAALLSAAAAGARRGDSREAYTALKAAATCAAELPAERADLGTVFGPTNVAIHQVAVAIELGNAREAVEQIPKVNLDHMPPLLNERRARFLIDVARSHAALRSDDAALDALLQAETIAPDELRHHRLTQHVVRDLMTRERRSSGLREIASRCNALH